MNDRVANFALAIIVTVVGGSMVARGQDVGDATVKHGLYHLIDLGTYGGPQSYVNIPDGYAPVLNDRGIVAGWADAATPDPYPNFCFDEDCFVAHAFRWINGTKQRLPEHKRWISSQANWLTSNGLIAGVVENGAIDPLVSGFPELRGVLWRDGSVSEVGTLPAGGHESFATAANGRGVVVGLRRIRYPMRIQFSDSSKRMRFGGTRKMGCKILEHSAEQMPRQTGSTSGGKSSANRIWMTRRAHIAHRTWGSCSTQESFCGKTAR